MDPARFTRVSEHQWRIEPQGRMRVPGIVFADEPLLREMDDKVYEQVTNVATLPGIVAASYAMPDAHWGYGFPIGGVAAFDAEQGGIISAGGVGFDISCGVRTLRTGLTLDETLAAQQPLADALFMHVPAGMGSRGRIVLNESEIDAMLAGGAQWAIERGWGEPADLERIEEHGRMGGAMASEVSAKARERQRAEMGTLGSGNHYVEVQVVREIFDARIAEGYGLREGEVVVSVHCGSRGLGHQIGTDFLRRMALAAGEYGLVLPDRELACAPIRSTVGEAYLGAMRAGINCALANRQIITHLLREIFARVLPQATLHVLYDVSHNTCKLETHEIDGRPRQLYVHRKGATRAFGPGHADLPTALQPFGQPVLIGGSMGTGSYVLAGTTRGESLAFSSSCHGAGRRMSRRQASKRWHGREVIDALARRGIVIRSHSNRGVAEEAPDAYKDVAAVVDAAHTAGLSAKVARLTPVMCIKG
ncbi:MAG: RtcB family protein [Candidatus Lambdaproteobacteria bacterium]|nr:RtcB family protein [Candidatus Lambdaproteobacteria bacterium]